MAEPLEAPDAHHLSAAEGWIGLGNHSEARTELDKISTENRCHPDVLEMRWQVEAHFKRWESCAELAERLISVAPDRSSGWIWRAQALYRLGKYAEALAALEPALQHFPTDPVVMYDLACYHCLLGQLGTARSLLKQALLIGGSDLRSHALADPDLQPLWPEFQL